MICLDPCYFPIVSPVTDGGDQPFCHAELCVNALDRLNSTGDPMGLDARHLDEREAGFSSTRTSWFRVTKPAPNEARIGLARPLIVFGTQTSSMQLCLYSLILSRPFCDMSLSSLTHLLAKSPPRVRYDSGRRERHRGKELMAMICVA
jgi:hypothetical protein